MSMRMTYVLGCVAMGLLVAPLSAWSAEELIPLHPPAPIFATPSAPVGAAPLSAPSTDVLDAVVSPPSAPQQTSPAEPASLPLFGEASSQLERDRQVIEPVGDVSSAIEQVQKAGLMNGFPDGQFHPERTLSRAELAVIVNKAFRLSERQARHADEIALRDVPASHWAASDIQVVVSRDVMAGYREGFFYPEQQVRRVEALAILGQAFGVHQFEPQAVDALLSNYRDAASIPDWARKSVATSLKYGFVDVPTKGEIRPESLMTRGEMAFAISQYLYRLNGTGQSKAKD